MFFPHAPAIPTGSEVEVLDTLPWKDRDIVGKRLAVVGGHSTVVDLERVHVAVCAPVDDVDGDCLYHIDTDFLRVIPRA